MFAITMPWVSGESAVCALAMIGASAKRAYAAAFQDNNLSVNLMGNTPGSAAFLSVGEVMGVATRLASYGSRRASSSPFDIGVENSGDFAGIIPKKPFHPIVFPAEECVVPAGEKLDGFLVPGPSGFGESVAFANDDNVAFDAAVDQSVVADVIIEVIVRGGLPVLVGYVCFMESHQPPLAVLAGEYTGGSGGCAPADPRRLVIVGPVLRLIHNRDAAGKYHSNIFGLLVSIGMDVAFGFPKRSEERR